MRTPIEPARWDGDGEPVWPAWIDWRDTDSDQRDADGAQVPCGYGGRR